MTLNFDSIFLWKQFDTIYSRFLILLNYNPKANCNFKSTSVCKCDGEMPNVKEVGEMATAAAAARDKQSIKVNVAKTVKWVEYI